MKLKLALCLFTVPTAIFASPTISMISMLQEERLSAKTSIADPSPMISTVISPLADQDVMKEFDAQKSIIFKAIGITDPLEWEKPSNVLKLFSEERAFIQFFELDQSGKLTYLVNTGTTSKKNIIAVHAWMRYLPVTVDKWVPYKQNADGSDVLRQMPCTYYVGLSTEIQAQFTVKARSVTLGGIFGIGAEAQRSNLSGSISVACRGINGQVVSDNIAMPAKLNEDTIAAALTSFAVIKSKIYDGAKEDSVYVRPLIIAADRNALLAKGYALKIQ